MLNMAEYTDFGLAVKTKLLISEIKTQANLAKEVSNKTGMFVDDAYLSKILTGQRNAPKIVKAISEILNIPPQQSHNTTDTVL